MSNGKIKLEIGKKYIRRDGLKIEIDTYDGSDAVYPFADTNRTWYTSDGRCANQTNGYLRDIIKEVHDGPVDNPQPWLMEFDPVTGKEKPYPSSASHFREYHGDVAWLYNPWTGKQRDPHDIGSDVFGLLLAKDTQLESISGMVFDDGEQFIHISAELGRINNGMVSINEEI